jgi:hypothetical protein
MARGITGNGRMLWCFTGSCAEFCVSSQLQSWCPLMGICYDYLKPAVAGTSFIFRINIGASS